MLCIYSYYIYIYIYIFLKSISCYGSLFNNSDIIANMYMIRMLKKNAQKQMTA